MGGNFLFAPEQYELLDFGGGRKLERIAGIEVLRDCPAASGAPIGKMHRLAEGQIVFEKNRGWKLSAPLPDDWQLRHREMTFNLRPTPFGHLGVFCEQVVNWDWLMKLEADRSGFKALNLFAYTGGSTLAVASCGASVVHVDAAKNVVGWARSNAASSGLADAPVRWIVDDAMKFVQREIKRGNRYDIIIADPPSIGHAGNKMTWKFDRDFASLLASLNQITSEDFLALLISCHTEGFGQRQLKQTIAKHFDLVGGKAETDSMDLVSTDGRRLNCGHYFRWSNV